jgi:hypothetical protein
VLLDTVLRVFRAFAEYGVRYKVVGAVALNLLGLARGTDDLDLFVEPTAENVERMKRALKSVFDDPAIDDITAEELLGDYPAIEYNPPEGTFHIDILQRLGEAFVYSDLDAEVLQVEGIPVPVVTPLTLYRMKKDTVRTQDRADAERLRTHFGLEEG